MRRQHKLFLLGLSLALGMTTTWAALAAGTALIYVANRGGTTIDVIDAATNKVVQTIDNIESPEVIRFSRDGSQLYIFSRSRELPHRYGSQERENCQKGAAQRLGQ